MSEVIPTAVVVGKRLLTVSFHPRQREIAAQTLRPVPDAVSTVTCTPDDEWCHHPKHVEQCVGINKLYIASSRWTIINIKIRIHVRAISVFWML